MKRKIWLICSILAIITAVILISTSVAFGASQSWFLRSDMIMVRNNPVMSSGSVDINQNQSVIWKSNETAASDVTFPSSSPWVVHLKVQGDNNQYANPWPSGTYTFDVGFYNDSSSSFTAFNTQTGLDFSWSGNVLTVEIQTIEGTVPTGNRLALRATNTGSSLPFSVVTDGNSYLTSPTSDPGFPLPEVAAGILLASGLLGLGGHMVIRRKRARLAC